MATTVPLRRYHNAKSKSRIELWKSTPLPECRTPPLSPAKTPVCPPAPNPIKTMSRAEFRRDGRENQSPTKFPRSEEESSLSNSGTATTVIFEVEDEDSSSS